MSLVALPFRGPSAEADARRALDELGRSSMATRGPRGDMPPIPRCNHPRWAAAVDGQGRRSPYYAKVLCRGGGHTMLCPCADPTEPHPNCHVATWQVGSVEFDEDGSVLLIVKAADLARAGREDPDGVGVPLERRLPHPVAVARHLSDGEPIERPRVIDVREERRSAGA